MNKFTIIPLLTMTLCIQSMFENKRALQEEFNQIVQLKEQKKFNKKRKKRRGPVNNFIELPTITAYEMNGEKRYSITAGSYYIGMYTCSLGEIKEDRTDCYIIIPTKSIAELDREESNIEETLNSINWCKKTLKSCQK